MNGSLNDIGEILDCQKRSGAIGTVQDFKGASGEATGDDIGLDRGAPINMVETSKTWQLPNLNTEWRRKRGQV